MKLSTRARYGLRLCFLIGVREGEVASLASLVAQTNLSEKYLEKILLQLKKGGVLDAKRGANGGYLLAKSSKDITLKQILSALDDDFTITDCATGGCDDDYCPNRRVMKKIYDNVDQILTQTTLADMIDEYRCDK